VPRKTNIYEFFEMGRPGDAKEKLPWTPGGTRHKKIPRQINDGVFVG